MGEVPQRELPAYYRAADVFLMPSEEEGFPHVLLEAAAAGIPYVASDVGGVREITALELRRYLVPSGDVSAFSSKILELLTAPRDNITRIASIEQTWVEQYDTHAVLPEFIKLFSK